MMMKRWNDPHRAGFDNCGVRYVRKIGVPLMLLIAVCVLILYAAMDLSAQPQEHILSIGLDVTALFGVVVLTAVCSIDRIPEDKSPLFFLAMLLCTYLELLGAIFGWLVDGKPSYIWINHICDVTCFVISPLMCALFWKYQDYSFLRKSGSGPGKSTAKLTVILTLMDAAYVLIGSATGILYTVDEMGYFHVQGAYWTTSIFPAWMMLGCFIGNLRREMTWYQRIAMLLLCLAPVAADLAFIFTPGYGYTYVVVFLALLSLYGLVQSERSMEFLEQRNLLIQQKQQLMLSQIQPHFLYNHLNTISTLCTVDPQLAREATDVFADYLRQNMDTLSQKTCVLFTKELDHVKNYVWLEQLRFGDRLTVQYDITCDDFRVPTLSVQPLVENAIKHGICKKEGGGTLTISTRETEDAYLVIIADDGAGFDVDCPPSDKRLRVGLENVRNRLQLLTNGTLTIQSAKQEGTVATVMIPKGGVG